MYIYTYMCIYKYIYRVSVTARPFSGSRVPATAIPINWLMKSRWLGGFGCPFGIWLPSCPPHPSPPSVAAPHREAPLRLRQR